MTQELVIRRPDDWHVHVRDGRMLSTVLAYTARDFGRAIIMPNLVPGVTTAEHMLAYRSRILEARKQYTHFEPLMTLYLTGDLTPDEVQRAYDTGFLTAVKFYPRGATTNSSQGIQRFEEAEPVLRKLEELNIPLLLHGETNIEPCGHVLDPFDKERYFVENELPNLMERFPALRLVLEHITTKEAAWFVSDRAEKRLGATITPHHLVSDRRAMFDGGLNPHFFCLPVLKRETDTKVLRQMATSKKPYFFAGTDSAPHPTHVKERACGCAGGCFVAPIAVPMYAQVFEEENSLDTLEAFLCENGADWYGLPRNTDTIRLVRDKEPVKLPTFVFGTDNTKVRIFGMHDDSEKSMQWNWQVT